jgi:hypothetical protein
VVEQLLHEELLSSRDGEQAQSFGRCPCDYNWVVDHFALGWKNRIAAWQART